MSMDYRLSVIWMEMKIVHMAAQSERQLLLDALISV